MIKLENVTKYYRMKDGQKHFVVKNISLEIPPNKNIAILGPNGAGKSTLLRLIGGAESPNSGKITSTAHISWPLGLNVGFQGTLTGRQNIQFVCEINGLKKSEIKQIMKSVQEFAEIGKFFDMPVKSYSSGMRARLGFGLSICFDFDYYLIDELTSVGDAIFRKKAQTAFEEIKKHASLIFVAHNLDTLRKSCDSALFLRNGEATYYEDIEEGITVYQEYIKKHSPPKKAAKKASTKKTTAAKKAVTKKNPVEKTTKETATKKAAKKTTTAKKVTAKKTAAKKTLPAKTVTPKKAPTKLAVKTTKSAPTKITS